MLWRLGYPTGLAAFLFLLARTTEVTVHAADWPTYQHDNQRTGFTPEGIDAGQLQLDWTWQSASPPQPAWAGPAKWDAYAQQRNLPSMRSYDLVFQVTAVGDWVYFGSSVDDSVHCLSAADGRERWSFTTDGPIRVAPSYAGGKLYFGSDDGHAYCVRAQDGSLVWKFRPHATRRLILNDGRFIPFHPCRTGVLVDGETAYFGAALLPWKQSYLCAVDSGTGRRQGASHFVKKFRELTLEGPLAASSQLLIFPQGRVAPRVFRRSDGEDQGQIKKSGGGSIVVVTLDSAVLHGPAADSRKGGIRRSDTQSMEMVAGYGRGNALVVAGHRSYMLTDDRLIASDLAARKVLWKVPCEYPHSLIMAGDTLFAGGRDAVAAFDAPDGKMLWSHPVQGRVFGMAAANGRLFLTTDTGSIYAFQAARQPSRPLATNRQNATEKTVGRPGPSQISRTHSPSSRVSNS